MRYMGGKTRIAKRLAAAIAEDTARRVCWEPFCGGASMTAALCEAGFRVCASDVHPGLADMWSAAAGGWSPPEAVSREEYAELRCAPTSPRRTFVGFGCSFGGKWWGGYASGRPNRNYALNASRSVRAKVARMRGRASFSERSFFDLNPMPVSSACIYCDPPYAGTVGYGQAFDRPAFWSRCCEWAAHGVPVYVSEYRCPVPNVVVWSGVLKMGLRRSGPAEDRVERLFRVLP